MRTENLNSQPSPIVPFTAPRTNYLSHYFSRLAASLSLEGQRAVLSQLLERSESSLAPEIQYALQQLQLRRTMQSRLGIEPDVTVVIVTFHEEAGRFVPQRIRSSSEEAHAVMVPESGQIYTIHSMKERLTQAKDKGELVLDQLKDDLGTKKPEEIIIADHTLDPEMLKSYVVVHFTCLAAIRALELSRGKQKEEAEKRSSEKRKEQEAMEHRLERQGKLAEEALTRQRLEDLAKHGTVLNADDFNPNEFESTPQPFMGMKKQAKVMKDRTEATYEKKAEVYYTETEKRRVKEEIVAKDVAAQLIDL